MQGAHSHGLNSERVPTLQHLMKNVFRKWSPPVRILDTPDIEGAQDASYPGETVARLAETGRYSHEVS